ncbi:TonB-dependent receptor [Paraglaciecola sp.]|uniref:TonB-dependent receptor n=1 Tax=Paraglaciecola sp. TaxID=1920173 RepID=UPI003263FDF2
MKQQLPQNFKPKAIAALIGLTFTLNNSVSFAQEAEPETALETITVTAQKRTQNLQEVPVSVTAFTGDEMAEAVIKDMYDLQTNVPGLGAFQSQSATNSSFSIRGVGTSSQNFGLESSVGLYVDGVYRARQNSMINNLVDVAAVEVLRGPQGTLFGKNTPSGAILVSSVAPSHDGGDSFVEATVGNYGLTNLSGAASISAIDDILAFRITAFGSQRDGTIDSVGNGSETGKNLLNDRNRWGARIQALYTPNDDVSVRIIADYADIDEICCGAPVQLSNATINPDGEIGSDLALPLLGGTAFAGGDAFYDREVAVSFLPESTMTDKGLSAEVDWELDENYTLVSISAYRNFESFDNIDTDFTDANLFGTYNDSKQSSFSQEIRIDYTGDNLNYILGAYYFTQDLDLDYSLYTDTFFNEFYMSSLGGALDDLFAGINAISAATGGAVAPVADAAPAGTGFDHQAKQQHESYAIFGQFDYELSDTLTLTAGLRYTDETKDLVTIFSENLANGSQSPDFFNSTTELIIGAGAAGVAAGNIGAALAGGQAPSAEDMAALLPFQTAGWGFQSLGATTASRSDIIETIEDDQITGSLKLSWQPSRGTLIYGSYGTGYKSGGTNTDRIADGFDPLFDAETSESLEVGIKKDFPKNNLRVNAAAHYTTVEDFQANTFTGNGFNLQNAGDYEISGFEVEATWLPVEDLEVNLAYAFVDAEYKTFEGGNCWVAYTWHTGIDDPGRQNEDDQFCDRSGDRPGGEPKHYAVLSVKKDFEVSDGIYAYVQGDFSHTSDMVLDGSNDPYAVQDAYNVVNLRFFMNFEEYDMDLIAWSRNVLDEEYINRTNFNAPLQDGKLNAYMSEPATFGLTLKKRF